MPRLMRLARDVTMAECDWLSRDYAAGERLWESLAPTYGCAPEGALLLSEDPAGVPWHEFPGGSALPDMPDPACQCPCHWWRGVAEGTPCCPAAGLRRVAPDLYATWPDDDPADPDVCC
jgi:hypothetical protein